MLSLSRFVTLLASAEIAKGHCRFRSSFPSVISSLIKTSLILLSPLFSFSPTCSVPWRLLEGTKRNKRRKKGKKGGMERTEGRGKVGRKNVELKLCHPLYLKLSYKSYLICVKWVLFPPLKKKKRPGKVEWIIQSYSEMNNSIDVSTSFPRKKAVSQIVFIACIVLLLGLIYLKQLSYVMRLCVFHKSLLDSKKENVLKL